MFRLADFLMLGFVDFIESVGFWAITLVLGLAGGKVTNIRSCTVFCPEK